VAYIDAHRDRFGVEPICRVLTEHGCKIAPNTYWVAKKRPPSARALRDEELKVQILRVHSENLDVYGADKVWTQLNREGTRVARCTVERLMGDLGLSGVRRGKAYKVTTRSDERQHRPSDLVDRDFTAPAPNRLWVADLTYVKTHVGWVYAAFIIDVFSRMIVGWQLSNSLRSDLAIDALEMAVWNRTRQGQVLDGLVHHSDKGVQYLSIRYSERLAENDIVASVGSTGDSYDNAMAEAFNSLYKWELIYPKGPWTGLDDVEFATMGYIDWFNHRRLHGEITDDTSYITPAEFEAAYYRQTAPALEAVTQ
jgi:putative transposase